MGITTLHTPCREFLATPLRITELCLQLTAGSGPVNGMSIDPLVSLPESCERAMLTMGDVPGAKRVVVSYRNTVCLSDTSRY